MSTQFMIIVASVVGAVLFFYAGYVSGKAAGRDGPSQSSGGGDDVKKPKFPVHTKYAD